MLLVGCGDDDDDDGGNTATPGTTSTQGTSESPTTAASDVQRGGSFKVPITIRFTEVLDPHRAQQNAAYFYQFIGNQLVRPSVDGKKIDMELAESCEFVGDGTELVIKLKPGLTWHDKAPTSGREIAAEDVAYNIMRIKGLLAPADQRASFQRASTLPNLDSATAVDPTTVSVKLTAPHAGFVWGLGDWRNSIIPKDFAEQDKWDGAGLIGSGPFVIESFENEVQATFKPNPTYFEEGIPYVDEVKWVWTPDAVSALAAFTQGNTDYIAGGDRTNQTTIERLGSASRVEWEFGNWSFIRFNPTKAPFNDPRVRRALALALDYKKMNDAEFGDGHWSYTGPIPSAFPETLQSDELAKDLQYDPSRREEAISTAKQLMSDAGFPDGGISFNLVDFPGALYQANQTRALDAWKTVWPALDGRIERAPDVATSVQRQLNGDFDTYWSAGNPFAHVTLDAPAFYSQGGSRNYQKWHDDEVESALKSAEVELDDARRRELILTAEKRLLDQAPMVGIQSQNQVYYFNNRVQNAAGFGGRLGGGSWDPFWGVRRMWLKS